MTVNKPRALALAAALVVSTAGAGCSWLKDEDDNKGTGDVPFGWYDDRAPIAINNGNGFPNISIKCRNGEAFFVVRDENGGQRFSTEPDSPQCDGNNVKLLPSDKKANRGTGEDGVTHSTRGPAPTELATTTTAPTADLDVTTTTLGR